MTRVDHTEPRFLAYTTFLVPGRGGQYVEVNLTMKEGAEPSDVIEFVKNMGEVTAWLGEHLKATFVHKGDSRSALEVKRTTERRNGNGQPNGQSQGQPQQAPVSALQQPQAPAQPAAPTQPTQPTQPQAPQQPARQPQAPTQEQPASGVAYAEILCDVLEGEMKPGGKTYWRVKGGRYTMHGVRIWPEVLADAGFTVEDLDPRDTYSLKGYRATVEIKDGKPNRISLLNPPA